MSCHFCPSPICARAMPSRVSPDLMVYCVVPAVGAAGAATTFTGGTTAPPLAVPVVVDPAVPEPVGVTGVAVRVELALAAAAPAAPPAIDPAPAPGAAVVDAAESAVPGTAIVPLPAPNASGGGAPLAAPASAAAEPVISPIPAAASGDTKASTGALGFSVRAGPEGVIKAK